MIDSERLGGFGNRQTDRLMNERTDIGDCRVAAATENKLDFQMFLCYELRLGVIFCEILKADYLCSS